MAQVSKSNVTVAAVKVEAADMLRKVIVAGKATRTAALDLCYSAACYMLLVSSFKSSNEKGYMTRSDARTFLEKQIVEQAGVKGKMLQQYIRNAFSIVGAMSDPVFSAEYNALRSAASADKMVAVMSEWSDKVLSTKSGLHRKVTSLRELSQAMGYAVSPPASEGNSLTAATAPEKAADAVKRIEKIVTEGDKSGRKASETVVAKAIIGQVSKPLAYAVEAIKRLTVAAELDALETAIKTQRQTLKSLASKATDAAKAKAKKAKATKRAKPQEKAEPVSQTV